MLLLSVTSCNVTEYCNGEEMEVDRYILFYDVLFYFLLLE